ncbi:MAG: hypothetical protein IJG45_00875 [Oscillospiraceae bacterium]|nr:hypothetical protein [Oscillospiraceae bacterium]
MRATLLRIYTNPNRKTQRFSQKADVFSANPLAASLVKQENESLGKRIKKPRLFGKQSHCEIRIRSRKIEAQER